MKLCLPHRVISEIVLLLCKWVELAAIKGFIRDAPLNSDGIVITSITMGKYSKTIDDLQ